MDPNLLRRIKCPIKQRYNYLRTDIVKVATSSVATATIRWNITFDYVLEAIDATIAL